MMDMCETQLMLIGSGTTTGGINWVGFLTTQDNDSLVLSYNLAFGGAVIDNSIIKGSQKCDMVCQVDLFQSTYSSKPESAPWTSENAVFGFWIGINEFSSSLPQKRVVKWLMTSDSAGNGYSNTDPNEIIPKLMKRYESLVEKIYSDGGRKFLFLNVPPTSRTPSFLAQGSDVQKTHMEWVAVYNKQLASMVKGFETDHPDVSLFLWCGERLVADRVGHCCCL